MAPPSYVLHVACGNFPSWTGNSIHRSPNLHVEARVSDQPDKKIQRTRTIKGSKQPKWNEDVFLRAANSSSKLNIRVKDSSKLFIKDRCIGEANIGIEDLLGRCKETSVALSLKASDGDRTQTSLGDIHIRLTAQDSTTSMRLASEVAHQQVSKLQPSDDRSIASETADRTVGGDPDDNAFITSLCQVMSKLDVLVNLVDKAAKVHPYVNLAWNITSSLYKAVKGQQERDQQLVDLANSMEEAYSFVDAVRDLPEKISLLQDNIEKLVTQTIESVILLREYTGHGFSGRLVRQTLSSTVKGNIAEMTQRFVDIKVAFTTGVVVHAALISSKVLNIAENIERMQYLELLNPVNMDGSLRSTCMPNTRQSVMDLVTEWVMTPSDGENILWLHGLAGSGKSTIATTLAEKFRKLGRLGAFLFFSRYDAIHSSPSGVVRTLAYQLARNDVRIGEAIAKAVKTSQNQDIPAATLDTQCSTLLLPLKSVPELENQGPIVVLLDAMDECGNVETRKPLLRLLSKELAQLPIAIRIVITSRNEPDIRAALQNKPHVCCMEVTTGTPKDLKDVRSYISDCLKELQQQDEAPSLPSDWPSREDMDALVERSAGLFIWAATAVKFIVNDPDPAAQITTLCGSQLRHEAESALDEIYSLALRGVNGWNHDDHKRDFCAVLGAIVFGRISMSDTTLDNLLNLHGSQSSVFILRHLTCILSWSKGEPVRPLHASFADYLSDRKRCGDQPWYIDAASYQLLLTRAAFRVMRETLRFNICDLSSSHVYNDVDPGRALRIHTNITPELLYACIFWAAHLKEAAGDDDVLCDVQLFFRASFLFWLEVLSFTKEVRSGITALTNAVKWLKSKDSVTAGYAADGKRLLSNFRKPISESAPHIYLSALPFLPRTSPIGARYRPEYNSTIKTKINGPDNWPLDDLVMEAHTASVRSVAFSPDGKRIASGSDDRTVRVWDAETGEVVSGLFGGHTSYVTTVAFSPDGKRIVSGSYDWTVRVWDAETGEVVSGPFECHTDCVNSVTFSPDGKRIVSGSDDQTVRVWDAETGEVVSAPFEGHAGGVNSVTYSPDGKRIASGSDDRTVRVWDAETGEVVSGPFEGHTGCVNSVTFSPDGKRIASASDDRTVRVWDAETREVVSRPFEGHTASVSSVAFSPDGKRIVSGSDDQTVRVWDAETREVVSGPFEGHTDWVRSVAFSPDGKRIVSGSDDRTTRVWDASTGEVVSGPFEGHTGWISSVGFSPNSERIVSGSDDQTVRVWDAETGEVVSGPFECHTDCVNSVTFSPDGKRIASGSDDQTVRVWDAETGDVVSGPFEGHTDCVNSVTFSPDGKRIVSGSDDQTVRVWDAETGEVVSAPFEGHMGGVNAVAFSPDGKRIVSGSDDQTVRVWDSETGEVVSGPFEGHTASVSSVAFSPDGKRIVSGSDDQTVRVWDAETGEVVSGPFEDHTHCVNSVTFSPDGRRIASGSDDQTVRVWDAETGEVLSGFEGHTDCVNSVTFSPDGKLIVSGSDDRAVRVWDAETGEVVLVSFEGHMRQRLHQAKASLNGNYDDESKMQDGWMLGKGGELLFWVPHRLRTGLWRPSNTLVIWKTATLLDLSNFKQGKDWTSCRTVTADSTENAHLGDIL